MPTQGTFHINKFFDKGKESAAKNEAYANNNMLRSTKAAVDKALESYQQNGINDDHLPSKAAFLAVRYCNLTGGLNEQLAGPLAEMNRLDLAQVGPLHGNRPSTFQAFEILMN